MSYDSKPEPGYQQTQLQATPGMTVKTVIVNPQHEGEWKHGLFSCFGDFGTCCVATFCPCVTFAKNKSRLEYLQHHGRADPEHGGSGCNGDCCFYGTLTACLGLGWILQIGPRGNLRDRHRIKGGGCGDCCAAWCCTPCALTQESRELEEEEKML